MAKGRTLEVRQAGAAIIVVALGGQEYHLSVGKALDLASSLDRCALLALEWRLSGSEDGRED